MSGDNLCQCPPIKAQALLGYAQEACQKVQISPYVFWCRAELSREGVWPLTSDGMLEMRFR